MPATLINAYLSVDPCIVNSQIMLPYDLFLKNEDDVVELVRARFTTAEKKAIPLTGGNNTLPDYLIYKKDLYAYCSQLEKFLEACFSDDAVIVSDKTKLAYNALRMCAELFFAEKTAENYAIFQKVIQTVFEQKPDLQQKLVMLKAMSDCNTIANHNVNVGLYGMGLGMMMRDKTNFDYMSLANALFVLDIGKCAVPPEVLNKESIYTPIDRNIIRRHPENGLIMMKKLTSVNYVMHQIILNHHERLDGKGYPEGLKGADVSLYARIAAIADVFDGLTSDRPHRKGHSTFEALKIMNNHMRGHLDMNLLSIFARLFVP